MRRQIVELPTTEDPKKLRQLLVTCEQMATEALREPRIATEMLTAIVETAKKAWDTSDAVVRDVPD